MGTLSVGGIDSATIIKKTVLDSMKVVPRLIFPCDVGGRRNAKEAIIVIRLAGMIKLKT